MSNKPKYKIEDKIVGRVDHISTSPYANQTVMIEIESARWNSDNGHWYYCGQVYHGDGLGEPVEILDWDVERKV